MLDALLAPRRRAHGSGVAVALVLHAAVVALVLLRRPAPRVVDVDLGSGPRIVKPGQNGGGSKASTPAPPPHDTVPRSKQHLRVRSHVAPTAPEPVPSMPAAADEPIDDQSVGAPAGVGDGASGGGGADASGAGGDPGEIVDATGVVRPTPRCAPPRMPEAARQMGITGAVGGHTARVRMTQPFLFKIR